MSKLKLIVFIICGLLTSTSLHASRSIFIGIMQDQEFDTVVISIQSGTYTVWSEGVQKVTLSNGNWIRIYKVNGSMKIETDGSQGLSEEALILKLQGNDLNSSLAVKLGNINQSLQEYGGDILITRTMGNINMINIVDLNSYLQGVIKAEIGGLYDPEFLKTMAIVSRTYALKNVYRHYDDGYDLCDNTHCQVYIGLAGADSMISNIIQVTTELVIVDDRNNLITAVYHSNSGGATESSEAVWSGVRSYLLSVNDPHSKHGIHFKWEYRMPLDNWKRYLAKKVHGEIESIGYLNTMKRHKHIICNGKNIPIQTIRKDLGLKSTLFSVKEKDDKVVFEGRGYGHGVGLSQEGAFHMSKQGKSYVEITQFYYTNVRIISYKGLNAFKDF